MQSDGSEKICRVEWNVTGTVLATSGEDFTVRLWKTDLTVKYHSKRTRAMADSYTYLLPFTTSFLVLGVFFCRGSGAAFRGYSQSRTPAKSEFSTRP
jgi:WD40 repeat protein